MSKMDKPYTLNQFKVLEAAFRGDAMNAYIWSRRARTRAINEMVAAKLVYGGSEGGDITPAGFVAYGDMCMRYDADSGCIAYAECAQEARAALKAASL